VIPVSEYKDSPGPITGSVKDAAIILQIIAGPDPSDEATASIPFDSIPDYVSACRLDALKTARIAVSKSAIGTVSDKEVMIAFEEALVTMSSHGATISRDKDFENWSPGSGQRENLTFSVLLKDGLESYFASLTSNPNNIHTMADLIHFMENTEAEKMSKYGADVFIAARDEKHTKDSKEFQDALQQAKFLGGDIQRLLDTSNCDVLVMPTSADVPYDLGQNPIISVPLGFYSPERKQVVNIDGLIAKGNNIPFSLSFVGRKFSEEKLIGIAYAFEHVTQVRLRAQTCVGSTVELPIPGNAFKERVKI